MARGYIADGYTEKATIAARPGSHEEVKITFRPMTALARTQLYDDWDSLSTTKQHEREMQAIADHLVSWDLQDWTDPDNPKPVPVSLESVKRLDIDLHNAMQHVVARLVELVEAVKAAKEQREAEETQQDADEGN